MINQIDLSKRIIFEDNHLIAVNKLPGWLVQGDKTGDESLVEALKKYIGKKYNKPGDVYLGCIHRLDRPVSGVVVFARTSKALERMNKLFESREVTKKYLAIVNGKPKKLEDTLQHTLVKDHAKNMVKASAPKAKNEGKLAILDYKVLSIVDGFTLLDVTPLTGRPHQIRAQLSAIRCPIIGDVKYGSPQVFYKQSIGLHSHQLSFVHPVSKENVTISAKKPDYAEWNFFND